MLMIKWKRPTQSNDILQYLSLLFDNLLLEISTPRNFTSVYLCKNIKYEALPQSLQFFRNKRLKVNIFLKIWESHFYIHLKFTDCQVSVGQCDLFF